MNPEWDQTVLITNPSHVEQIKGHVMILVKDNNNLEDVIRIYVPLQSMGLFVPYNLKLIQPRVNETSSMHNVLPT